MNLRPSGYEPDELPGCSTPRQFCWLFLPLMVFCGWFLGLGSWRFGDRFREGFSFSVWSGGDLLSHVLRRSTIGATALNGRVRDGIGCFARAMATRPEGKRAARRPGAFALGPCAASSVLFQVRVAFDVRAGRCALRFRGACHAVSGSDQACRAISTGQLNALPRLHLRPIDVVVFHGPQGRPCFEGGFPLRCLQRLSCPLIATQHCRWHDNWSTSGAFTPVLSY